MPLHCEYKHQEPLTEAHMQPPIRECIRRLTQSRLMLQRLCSQRITCDKTSVGGQTDLLKKTTINMFTNLHPVLGQQRDI